MQISPPRLPTFPIRRWSWVLPLQNSTPNTDSADTPRVVSSEPTPLAGARHLVSAQLRRRPSKQPASSDDNLAIPWASGVRLPPKVLRSTARRPGPKRRPSGGRSNRTASRGPIGGLRAGPRRRRFRAVSLMRSQGAPLAAGPRASSDGRSGEKAEGGLSPERALRRHLLGSAAPGCLPKFSESMAKGGPGAALGLEQSPGVGFYPTVGAPREVATAP